MNGVRLPKELQKFFDHTIGRSLMVKGQAGTGKTIFSLSLLEEIAKIDNSFYFSTRVSNEALYSQFEWLKDKDWRENIIDTSLEFLRTITPGTGRSSFFREGEEDEVSEMEKVQKAKKLLKEIREGEPPMERLPDEVSRSMLLSLSRERKVDEIEEIYQRVDERLPEPSLIIIDSLESLTERYEIESKKLIKTLQKDLVERSGVRLIFVLEEEKSTKWDYLVDGVVTLSEEEWAGRRMRHIYLNKLRGVRIDRPHYIFTLDDGKFRYFETFSTTLPEFKKSHIPIEDGSGSERWNQGVYSSGSEGLDEILGGGFPHDGMVVIEFTENVPFSGQLHMYGPVIENFLSQDRGVLATPPAGKGNKAVEDLVKDMVSEGRENLKMLRFEDLERGASGALDLNDYKEHFRDAYKEVKYRSREPILTVADWIKLEHTMGGENLRDADRLKFVKNTIDIIRENSGLSIGLMGPGFSFAERAKYIADVYIKVFTLNNSLLMMGEKPNTEIFNITRTDEEHPQVEFVPLV